MTRLGRPQTVSCTQLDDRWDHWTVGAKKYLKETGCSDLKQPFNEGEALQNVLAASKTQMGPHKDTRTHTHTHLNNEL